MRMPVSERPRAKRVVLAALLLLSAETTAFAVGGTPLQAYAIGTRPLRRSDRGLAVTGHGGRVGPRQRQIVASLDGELLMEGVAVAAFASSHIGMSSIREPIIRQLGEAADAFGFVGTGWRLPEFWQGQSLLSAHWHVPISIG